MNPKLTDVASGLTTALTRDGQSPATANLPMGGFRHTNISDGVIRTDYASLGQVQDSSALWAGTAGGTGNALTVTLTPAITAYPAGLTVRFLVSAVNSSSVTLSVNGLTAQPLRRWDGTEWGRSALQAGQILTATYSGSDFRCTPGGITVEQIGPVSIASGASAVDFVLAANYRSFRLIGANITPSANATIGARISSDGGGTYAAGASDYGATLTYANSTTVVPTGGSASSVLLTSTTLGNDPRVGFELAIDPGSASRPCNIRWDAGYVDSTSNFIRASGFGSRNASALATNFRILPSSGTLSGSFYLLGYR